MPKTINGIKMERNFCPSCGKKRLVFNDDGLCPGCSGRTINDLPINDDSFTDLKLSIEQKYDELMQLQKQYLKLTGQYYKPFL